MLKNVKKTCYNDIIKLLLHGLAVIVVHQKIFTTPATKLYQTFIENHFCH